MPNYRAGLYRPDQMRVRSLTLADAETMADIHKTSFPAGWPAEDMARHIEKDLALGIGTPLQSFILAQYAEDQADILTLATDPAHRRQGQARQLLEATENVLTKQGVKTLYLDVSEINHGAIALYRSSGFQAVGRRPAYYRTAQGRVAAITFSKTLFS